MKQLKNLAVAGAVFVAAAYALPGELVVVSNKEVRPDEAAGFYYLGSCAAGYLYSGSSAAVGRVAPYRLLDRDAQAKDYYIVWAPAWVKVTAADFAHLGTAVRLSEYEILVDILGAIRPEILAFGLSQSENEKLFKQLLHDDMQEWIKNKNWDSIENHLRAVTEDRIGDDWLPGIRTLFNEE